MILRDERRDFQRESGRRNATLFIERDVVVERGITQGVRAAYAAIPSLPHNSATRQCVGAAMPKITRAAQCKMSPSGE